MRPMKTAFRAVIAAAANVLAVSAATAQTDPSAAPPWLAPFSTLVEDHGNVAYGAALAKGGDAAVIVEHGLRFRGSEDQVGPDALWHIGSITKSFTAVLVLQLVEEGLLDLDAPIGPVFAEHGVAMHADWANSTLRQLLSHTAGLQANVAKEDFGKTWSPDLAIARSEVLQSYWSEPATGTPGTFHYSNLGYVLAGHLAETVAGEAWETLVLTRIAEPLGMTSVGFGAPNDDKSAWGHRTWFGMARPVDPDGDEVSDNPAWMAPAGTLHMTLADLVTWGQAHLDACAGKPSQLLSGPHCDLMKQPIADDYGLGWVTQTMDDGTTVVWHNGSNTMWYTLLVMVPEADLVLALSQNTGNGRRIDLLSQAILEGALQD